MNKEEMEVKLFHVYLFFNYSPLRFIVLCLNSKKEKVHELIIP